MNEEVCVVNLNVPFGQVRTCAVDTLVEIYHHVGVKVRIDLSKRNLPPQKLAMLNSKFDEIDGSHGNVTNEQEVFCSFSNPFP